jgi:hypothetical protein
MMRNLRDSLQTRIAARLDAKVGRYLSLCIPSSNLLVTRLPVGWWFSMFPWASASGLESIAWLCYGVVHIEIRSAVHTGT